MRSAFLRIAGADRVTPRQPLPGALAVPETAAAGASSMPKPHVALAPAKTKSLFLACNHPPRGIQEPERDRSGSFRHSADAFRHMLRQLAKAASSVAPPGTQINRRNQVRYREKLGRTFGGAFANSVSRIGARSPCAADTPSSRQWKPCMAVCPIASSSAVPGGKSINQSPTDCPPRVCLDCARC